MCGRMNVTDDPFLKGLSEALGISSQPLRHSKDVAPGATVSIVKRSDQHNEVVDATWWLLLDKTTHKPNYKYASFNSRSDKLNQSTSLAYRPYREHRCVIPASGFVEGLGDKKTYHHLTPDNHAIAFGGIFKEWLNQETGELIYSASVITLPPHDKLKTIHPKSMPLMLPWKDQKTMALWLDPDFHEVDAFQDLLKPKLLDDMIVTPIDKPSKRSPIGESFVIDADAA